MTISIELLSKDNCAYCEKAKFALEQQSLDYTVKKLDVDFDRDYVVENYPQARTFPIVVVNGEYLGGFAELSLMLERMV
jgi:glutaredoxin 3